MIKTIAKTDLFCLFIWQNAHKRIDPNNHALSPSYLIKAMQLAIINTYYVFLESKSEFLIYIYIYF